MKKQGPKLRVDWPSMPGDLMLAKEADLGLLWAKAEAQRALLEMGADWSARVWYNLGWHFALHRPFLNLHPSVEHRRVRGKWTMRIDG